MKTIKTQKTRRGSGSLHRLVRACVICGARVRNENPRTKTCSPTCTAKLHGKPEPEPGGPVCQHCGVATTEDEGTVCDLCYSRYTPAMLNDMDQ